MIKRLLLMLVGILLGTFLAYIAVLYLQNWILPLSCALIVAMIIGWLVWIQRGGLKKNKS